MTHHNGLSPSLVVLRPFVLLRSVICVVFCLSSIRLDQGFVFWSLVQLVSQEAKNKFGKFVEILCVSVGSRSRRTSRVRYYFTS